MVKTLVEYVAAIVDVSEKWSLAGNFPQLWFRGQRLAKWSLVPSYYREFDAYIPDVENTYLTRYKLRGSRLVRSRPTKRWEWLYLMQHYGFPTRLLDWTDSAFIALYFAVRDHLGATDEDHAAVWVLDPVWLNSTSVNLSTVVLPDWEEIIPYFPFWKTKGTLPSLPVAVEPLHVTERLTAQRGHFTIHGHLPSGLNEIDDLRGTGHRCARITIQKSAVARIERQLAQFGVQETTVFPDLEGLSKELRRHLKKRR